MMCMPEAALLQQLALLSLMQLATAVLKVS